MISFSGHGVVVVGMSWQRWLGSSGTKAAMISGGGSRARGLVRSRV